MNITSLLNKKRFFLYSICICICILLLSTQTRAQELSPANDVLKTQTDLIQGMNNFIGIASWIRIIPAKLAGLFMTNYFVYGNSFYLADYLFKFWQIIRTFTLYGLGLYFVGYILYAWFNGEEAKSKIADLFKNTLIAGILISMSRWLVAASVDLSIVLTSTVAAIPSHIYEQERSKKMQCFDTPKQVIVGDDRTTQADPMGNPTNHEPPPRAKLKPEGDDASGPLMFFGTSVLKFFDMVYIPDQSTAQGGTINKQRDASKTLIVVFVKAILAAMLIIPMVILMIVNLMRIVFLWLWIVFAPGIVLINVFGIELSESLKKYVSWQNILGLILQPVAVVGMLSIGLIFIIELASIFNLCVQNPQNNSVLAQPISEGIDAPVGDLASPIGTETTLGASLSNLGDIVGGITGQLILAIFVIILVRSLIKVGFSFSELTKETASGITESVEKIAASVPIVPLPGAGLGGLGAAKYFAKDQRFGLKKRKNMESHTQDNILNNALGINQNANIGELHEIAKKDNTALANLKKSISHETEKYTIRANDAKSIVQTWLQANGTSLDGKKELNDLRLTKLAETTEWTDEKLQKLWEGAEKNEAYKLLNWLFTHSDTTARNTLSTTAEYGGWGKKE